jgi:hypothetical protein
MVYPVLEFREKKRTSTKAERGNVDFLLFPFPADDDAKAQPCAPPPLIKVGPSH